jgi:putative membrane protein insertion efficiency factor
MGKPRKAVAWTLFALCFYLAAEALLPPSRQPSARICLTLIDAYQATGSHLMEAGGVRCRYTPTCSHYAEDAISHFGTLNGGMRAAGRILRCAPWGGAGYDPAVDTHPAAYLAPQESTTTRGQSKELTDDEKKAIGAACAAGGVWCAFMAVIFVVAIVLKVLMIVWVYKDSKARGDQNAVLWIVLLVFTNIIGLVIYLVARPKGDLFPCPDCHQKKLETVTRCPHCGNEAGGAAAPKPPQA